jgi:hypothetical protein
METIITYNAYYKFKIIDNKIQLSSANGPWKEMSAQIILNFMDKLKASAKDEILLPAILTYDGETVQTLNGDEKVFTVDVFNPQCFEVSLKDKETTKEETTMELTQDFVNAYATLTNMNTAFVTDEEDIKAKIEPLLDLTIQDLRLKYKKLRNEIRNGHKWRFPKSEPNLSRRISDTAIINRYDLTQLEKAVLYVISLECYRDTLKTWNK